MVHQQRYCFALDLVPDPALIAEYEAHHTRVWPSIIQSIKDTGIINLEIYRVQNRLFMIVDVNENFSLEKKKISDEANPVVQEWEQLMWKYQQAIPGAAEGEKWILMKKIFQL